MDDLTLTYQAYERAAENFRAIAGLSIAEGCAWDKIAAECDDIATDVFFA